MTIKDVKKLFGILLGILLLAIFAANSLKKQQTVTNPTQVVKQVETKKVTIPRINSMEDFMKVTELIYTAQIKPEDAPYEYWLQEENFEIESREQREYVTKEYYDNWVKLKQEEVRNFSPVSTFEWIDAPCNELYCLCNERHCEKVFYYVHKGKEYTSHFRFNLIEKGKDTKDLINGMDELLIVAWDQIPEGEFYPE